MMITTYTFVKDTELPDLERLGGELTALRAEVQALLSFLTAGPTCQEPGG